jgi:hypothetical protein
MELRASGIACSTRDCAGPRLTGQQVADVDDVGGGKKYRHGAQDDRQDHVEQESSERNKEAELEGCACANPDFLRRCDAVRVGHVLTLPSRRKVIEAPLPHAFDDLYGCRSPQVSHVSHVLQTLPEQRQEAELTHFPDA